MAGIDLVFPGQRTDLAQGGQFFVHIPTGQIHPPAASAEECVAGEESVLTAQGHAAGGVTGGADHVKAQSGQVQAIAVLVVFPVLGQREREVIVPTDTAVVLLMHVDDGTRLLLDPFHRTDMVVVAVGQENGLAVKPVILQIVEDGVALIAGVNDNALQRLFVGDHIAVGLQLADRQRFDQHGFYSSFVSKSMVTGPSFWLSTCMSAPNSPVRTVKPCSRQRAITSS